MREFDEFNDSDDSDDDDYVGTYVPVTISYPSEWQLPIAPNHEIAMGYIDELMWVRVDEIVYKTKRPILTADEALVLPDRCASDEAYLAHDRGFLMGVYYAVEAMLGEKVADRMLDEALSEQRRKHGETANAAKALIADESMNPEYV